MSLILVYDGSTRRSNRVDTEGTLMRKLRAINSHLRISVTRVKVFNHPGTIDVSSHNTLCDLVNREGVILVSVVGEEDLLALPLLACMPVGSAVAYGIPGVGAAVFRVTSELRAVSASRLIQFTLADLGIFH